METLFVSRGAKLRQRDNTLAITLDGRTRSLPVERVAHLVLLAESDLNTRLLTLCGAHGVRVSVFDYYGNFKGAFEPLDRTPSGRVKLAQAELVLDTERRLAVAREIVRGAGHNLKANLLYYRYRGREALAKPIREIDHLLDRLPKARDCEMLMGFEGQMHQWYYDAWACIDSALAFGPRVRRPPNNPLNCLLSFLNQLTYAVMRHELFKTHLETAFSLLHSPHASGRHSLALDLAEPFKPVLVDMLIFRMVRRNMLDDAWFEQHDGVCLLTDTGRRHVAEQYALRLEEKYQDRTFREWIYREAIGIERHVLGLAEYEAFKRRV